MNDPRKNPNGCGPHWLPAKYKDDYFKNACRVHDTDYMNGDDQYIADLRFYELMKKTIRDDVSLSWFERRTRYAQAWFYFNIVRVFGWTSHKDGLDL